MISSKRVIQSTQTKFNPAINQYWLAGSEYYGSTLAGGDYFHPSTFGAAKLFGLSENYITQQAMIEKGAIHTSLNNPYMSVLNLVNGGEFIALYDFIKNKQTTVVVLTTAVANVGTAYAVFTSDSDVSSFDLENLNAEFSSNIAAMSAEMQKDSTFEDALESFGYSQFGALGYAAGGIIGGLMDGKDANIAENIAEAVSAEMKSQAVSAGLKALGIKNIAVASIAALAIGMVLDEAMEVAMGLDNNFGFGGDYVGTDMTGKSHFAGEIGFMDGIVGAFQEFATFGTYHSVFDKKKQEALVEMAKANFKQIQELNALQAEIDATFEAQKQAAIERDASNGNENGSDFGGSFNGGAGGAGGFGSQQEAADGGYSGGW